MWTEQVKDIALGIRRRAFEHTVRAHGGYLSQACSLAELLATLYIKVLQIYGCLIFLQMLFLRLIPYLKMKLI